MHGIDQYEVCGTSNKLLKGNKDMDNIDIYELKINKLKKNNQNFKQRFSNLTTIQDASG